VSKGAKLLGSYIVAKKVLGTKQSILLGIGLSVRFSTSIVVIKILFENGLVGSDVYSVIVASSIAFKFIIPVLFANLLVRWKIAEAYKNKTIIP
jgi:Kef-type K+ transport system membrane component KefB